MIRRLAWGQEDLEQILGLTQTQSDRGGNRRELSLLAWVEKRWLLGTRLQFSDPALELLDLGLLLGKPRLLTRGLGQSLLDLAGMLIDRLAAALGILCLLSHRAVLTREDSGRIADPGADR